MKKILVTGILLALLTLSLCLTGCGGNSSQSEADARSLLTDVSQAMSTVSSYRMTGTMTIEGFVASGSEYAEDFQDEIQVVNGETHVHYLNTSSDPAGQTHNVDIYEIGEQEYRHDEDGWTQWNTIVKAFASAIYDKTSLSNGVANPKLMVTTAQDLKISGEDSDRITLSYHLGKDYVDALLASMKRRLEQSGRWTDKDQQQLDQYDSSLWQADVAVSVFKANNLIDHLEMDSTTSVGEDSHQETVKAVYNLFDYNQDIRVDLPDEAKSAPSIAP
jgi:hypothetical protein